MSLPRYPEYKDSGVEWLGEVPAHWEVRKLRSLARLESGHTPSRQHPEWWVEQDCVIPWFTLADVSYLREDRNWRIESTSQKISHVGMENSAARLLPPETVLLSRTASVGFSGVTAIELAVSQDFAAWICGPRLRPFYVLLCLRAMKQEFRRLMMGSTHQTIYMPDIEAFRVPVPPLAEQDRIAEFLNRETAKIDALVAEQQRLIELLKEKRQAVISHAVTKGLNPNVAMKDSGIEWLGEVPAHWTLGTVRRFVDRIEQGWSPECFARPADADEWGVLKAGCANRGVFSEQENKALPDTLAPVPAYEVQVGDVIMSRASGSPELVGSTAYVSATRPKLMLSDKIFRIHVGAGVHPQFFVHSFNSRVMRSQIERAISGADGLANNLPQSALATFFLLAPPMREQELIVERVTEENARLDALIAQATRTIDLLTERRTALISAAVTGQVDVRPPSARRTA